MPRLWVHVDDAGDGNDARLCGAGVDADGVRNGAYVDDV